jgi:hypothetical protein
MRWLKARLLFRTPGFLTASVHCACWLARLPRKAETPLR